MSKACPTCHRPFERRGRWCFACDRPIGRRHKWHAEGIYNRHDDCANPEMRQDLETPLLMLSPSTHPTPPEVPDATQKENSAG